MVLTICLMAAVDVCWAKSSDVRKMVKLKMNNFLIILFDDQRCYLQTDLNILFDLVTIISNGEWYLFDARSFWELYPIILIFGTIAENSGSTA